MYQVFKALKIEASTQEILKIVICLIIPGGLNGIEKESGQVLYFNQSLISI
jgi:hypothetical protein